MYVIYEDEHNEGRGEEAEEIHVFLSVNVCFRINDCVMGQNVFCRDR